MNNLKIYGVILIILLSKNIFSEIPLNCIDTFYTNTATIGDSRAHQFVFQDATVFTLENHIQRSEFQGKKVLSPGQIVLMNRSWSGSHARDWVSKIRNCQNGGKNFKMPEFTLTSLGGNDLLNDIYKKRKDLHDQYHTMHKQQDYLDLFFPLSRTLFRAARTASLRNLLNNPLRTIQSLVNDALSLSRLNARTIADTMSPFSQLGFLAYWQWYLGTETDRITQDMEFVARHVLDQSPNHKMVLNTVQPVSPFVAYAYRPSSPDYPELIKVFSMLHFKYRHRLFPKLVSSYGSRVTLLDSYPYFLMNIIEARGGTGSYYSDGIHFNSGLNKDKNDGLQKWGMLMAMSMGFQGWVQLNIESELIQDFFADMEISLTKVVMDAKAIEIGIPINQINGISLALLLNGFKKDFSNNNGKMVYSLEGSFEAYSVQGLVLDRYIHEGGPQGRFGFPTTDEWADNFGTIKNSDFECGRIYFNHINGQTTSDYKPDDPAYKDTCDAKKARDANP